jgi:UDP-glucose 4-epimerase
VELDNFRDRRCVVTGGLGFIGSNLARKLARLGARVTVVDARYPRHGSNVHNLAGIHGIDVFECDLGDSAVRTAVEGADYVFNLAGQVSHVDSMNDPLFDLDVNTRSQLAFLETLRHGAPDAMVVFTSTRQLFGRPRYLPVDEEHPISPVDVNGVSKYAAERFHLLYGDCYGLPVVILRLTNVYGPRQRLRDDFQGFLPIFVRRALLGETIQVFGDGAQQRDCLYVADVVECLLHAANPDVAGEVFNIGNDEHLSVLELAHAVVNAAGTGEVVQVPWPADRDAIDIGSYFGDPSKAKRLLDWTPETPFVEGIERTIAFYRAHVEAYL